MTLPQLPRYWEYFKRSTTAPMNLYSLYERNNGQWKRIAENAYTYDLAVRVFASRLFQNPNRMIRRIKLSGLKAQSKAARFYQPSVMPMSVVVRRD